MNQFNSSNTAANGELCGSVCADQVTERFDRRFQIIVLLIALPGVFGGAL
jgi:hypothetical protein